MCVPASNQRHAPLAVVGAEGSRDRASRVRAACSGVSEDDPEHRILLKKILMAPCRTSIPLPFPTTQGLMARRPARHAIGLRGRTVGAEATARANSVDSADSV